MPRKWRRWCCPRVSPIRGSETERRKGGKEERRVDGRGGSTTHAMHREEDAVDEAEARSGLVRADSAERLDDALHTAMAWCGAVRRGAV